MPIPAFKPALPAPRDSRSASLYACLNAFCRCQASEKLHECPQCQRVGEFMSLSDMAARSLLLGFVIGLAGVGIFLFGLFFLIGAASGSLTADTGYSGTYMVIAVGVTVTVFGVCAAFSARRGNPWLFWLCRLVLWS